MPGRREGEEEDRHSLSAHSHHGLTLTEARSSAGARHRRADPNPARGAAAQAASSQRGAHAAPLGAGISGPGTGRHRERQSGRCGERDSLHREHSFSDSGSAGGAGGSGRRIITGRTLLLTAAGSSGPGRPPRSGASCAGQRGAPRGGGHRSSPGLCGSWRPPSFCSRLQPRPLVGQRYAQQGSERMFTTPLSTGTCTKDNRS